MIQLKDGEATERLSKLIPFNLLEGFYFIFQVIEQYEGSPKPFVFELQKRIDELQNLLTALQGQSLLIKEGKEMILYNFITNLDIFNDRFKLAHILYTMICKQVRTALNLPKRTGRNIKNPKEQALKYLIYMLVGYLKYQKIEKPHYSLIADFLNEQDIAYLSDTDIKKRFDRYKEDYWKVITPAQELSKLLGEMTSEKPKGFVADNFYHFLKSRNFKIID